jgi:protoporphyrinogen oxidase
VYAVNQNTTGNDADHGGRRSGLLAESVQQRDVVIIGAGPAGLTAGYELAAAGRSLVVLEKDGLVGGIARTVSHNGYLFDIGGHRFFTKVDMIDALWREMLEPDEWVTCARLSRIFYNKRFFYYPLRMGNVIAQLGFWNSLRILLSYFRAHFFPRAEEKSFEDWVVNRFGERLYRTFFKSYTEKVWGIPCSEIQADWAAQRIQGLSFISAVKNALLGAAAGAKGDKIGTLINTFQYPRRGPGMLWRRVTEKIERMGGAVHLNRPVTRIHHAGGRVIEVETTNGEQRQVWRGNHFISSMPLSEWVLALSPAPPTDVLEAARALKYRDFLTVAVMINQPALFPDHWIYIHDPSVHVGRIQNFKKTGVRKWCPTATRPV